MSQSENQHYTPVAKFLHWLVAALIVLQFLLAQLADNAASDLRELALLANHKSVGITILFFAVARIFWRLMNKPPALPASMPNWQIVASHISHWSLYALLFAIPITGWLMSSASAYSVSWFNLIQLPDFVAPDAELAERFENIHETLAKLLLVLAGLHIFAAIKHHFVDKDDVLRRMVSAFTWAFFILVVTAGGTLLGRAGKSPDLQPGLQLDVGVDASSAANFIEADSDLPIWQIDHATSFIKFTGDQAGATFDGVWGSWSARLQFDIDDLASSAFEVTIDTTSADTQDVDRDTTLNDPEWFDTTNFPEAYFRAATFSVTDTGYAAAGQLTIKDVASPATLQFTVEEDGVDRILLGTAQLDRLALGVGTGEWQDTEWIGKDVQIEVRVEATVN